MSGKPLISSTLASRAAADLTDRSFACIEGAESHSSSARPSRFISARSKLSSAPPFGHTS